MTDNEKVDQDPPQEEPAAAPAESEQPMTGDPAFGTGAPTVAPQPETEEGPEEQPGPAAEQPEAAAGQPADKAQEYLELAQRKQAELENFRKRAVRDAAMAEDRGMQKLLKELLPALDHLSLALQAAREDESELARGVRMVQDELIGALNKVGIQAFSPEGEPFDPNEHEAMVQQPGGDGVEPGTVLTVYQAGYRVNGKVLRPARVVVAA